MTGKLLRGLGATAMFLAAAVPAHAASPPGAPRIAWAVGGNAQATIAFLPPLSDGGSPITGYTATCDPGAFSATGPASPITVTGLTNGVAYSCSVTATNSAGTGSSSLTSPVTPAPVTTSVSGPSATGTGTITASFTGGGPGCTFTSARFVPFGGFTAMDLNPPLNVAFPQGFFDFTLQGCVPGSTITMTMVYPSVLPQGTQYWKYGPAASAHPTPFWFHLPATIAGNAVTFTITDGATDDGDFSTDGRIVDPSGPGVPFNSSDVPSLGEWALVAMASLLLASGLFAMRRRAVRRR